MAASKCIVVNPWHWLDADGSLPVEPPRLRALALRVAQCIEAGGPIARRHGRETLIPCRRRPGGKTCPGLLHVRKQDDDAILAFCVICRSDELYIHSWGDTLWAEGAMEPLLYDEVAADEVAAGVVDHRRGAHGDQADEVFAVALRQIGSRITPAEAREIIARHSDGNVVLEAILRDASKPITTTSLDRFMPALVDFVRTVPIAVHPVMRRPKLLVDRE